MTEYRKYSIKQNRFKRSFLAGFETEGENILRFDENNFHRIFVCDCIDGVEREALWGRIHIDWELAEDMLVVVHVAATDDKTVRIKERELIIDEVLKSPDRSVDEKLQLMADLEEKKQVNKKDFLLYELKGRYLYLMIEVRGLGNGFLTNMFVNNQADILSKNFEEVCREYGSFYHRYMSVFSTMYMDFEDRIEQVSKLLDIDTAPMQLLPIFGQWMGLEINNDFLSEDKLRTLVKEAYKLNRIKGTKEAISRICEIVLEEEVVILEKNVLRENIQAENQQTNNKLFGDGIYDVTILLHKHVTEKQKSELLFLLNQFKPVRCRIKLKYLEQNGNFDRNVYMDMNAHMMDVPTVLLDESAVLDENMIIM